MSEIIRRKGGDKKEMGVKPRKSYGCLKYSHTFIDQTIGVHYNFMSHWEHLSSEYITDRFAKTFNVLDCSLSLELLLFFHFIFLEK